MKFVLQLAVALLISIASYSQVHITVSSLRSGSVNTGTTYFVTDAGRQGLFYYDRSDVTSTDNGGTVVVNAGRRFKRMYSGPIDVRWFGAKADYSAGTGTDNAPAIRAALNAAARNQVVMIPQGNYMVKSTVAMPVTKKLYFEIYGDIYFTKGAGFVVEGSFQTFKSYGVLSGGNTGATSESAYLAYSGTGVYIKNAYQCDIEVNEVKDFKYGIHMSGDKNGGSPNGCQYNRIRFNSIHHNHTQIRISTIGTTSSNGNWNNSSFWYGGQLGRGPAGTFGKGGWIGVHFVKDPTSNAGDPMNGHMFHDVGFEGLEKGIVMVHARYNSFFGGRFEPPAVRQMINLDPTTAVANKFVGHFAMIENMFVPGRLGSSTIISGTPVWSNEPNQILMGYNATNSINSSKFLIETNKYAYTNFEVAKTHDVISNTGEFPTVQAMTSRINGVKRSVPFKSTFYHVKTSTGGSPLTLPANIGSVRFEASQAKVLKINVGDIVINGFEFLVDYRTPQYALTFVRSDNSAVLIAPSHFNSAGVYRCVYFDGVFRVSKLGEEYKTVKWTGSTYSVPVDVQTVFMNATANPAVVTLPSAALWPGREIIIKNLQATRTVQVNGVSSSDENLIRGRGAITVKSDGAAWNIIHFYKRNLSY